MLGFMGAISLSKRKTQTLEAEFFLPCICFYLKKLDTRRGNQALYFYIKISDSTAATNYKPLFFSY